MESIPHRKTQQNRKDAILVLGMHRSGTSMLAGILQELGCKGPKTPIEANERNPKGYFESQRVLQLNDEILAAAGTRWNDWQPLRGGWHVSPRFTEFRARAVDVIRAEYGDASMIYLKDPRICRLLPLWRDVFEDMGYRVACVLTHRHPVDVAASLKARKNIEVEPSLGMLSWLRYVLDAEAASRDLPRLFTSYSSLLLGWQDFADRAEQVFGFTWPAMTHTSRERVAALVDPRLRHHCASIDAFVSDPLMPEPFREILRVLERWAQDGEDGKDHAVLDRLRRDFDQSAPLLYAPITALETATREVKTLLPYKTAAEARQAEIDTLTTRLAEVGSQRDEASARESQLTAELTQNRVVVKDARDTAEARQAEIDTLTTRLAEVGSQRGQVTSQIEQMREELEQTRRSADELQADVDALSARLAKAELREAKLSAEGETWAERLIERDKKIFALQRESDRRRHDTTAKIAELSALSTRLAKVEGELGGARSQEEAVRKELGKACKTGEARQAEITVLTAKLAEVTRTTAAQNAQLRKELEQSQKASKACQAELSNKIATLVTQLRDMKGVHVRAINDLHDIYRTSTSWRLSAPVRIVGKLVRGG